MLICRTRITRCSPYRPSDAPPLDLTNSPRLENLIRDGKLYISLHDAIALAIENNLDLAYFRYNFPIAQTDYARTKAGGSANGVNTGIVQSSTQGGFSWGQPAAEAQVPGRRAAGAGGIVTSTLGAGTQVPSFDPFLNFKGFVDHNCHRRRPMLPEWRSHIQAEHHRRLLPIYSQTFPMGTG